MSTAIQISHLSKRYNLGLINRKTLFREIQSFTARLRRRSDPNIKISDTRMPKIDRHSVIDALRDVSISITTGEVVGIIGNNGAGKSTLLKILSRVTSPSAGIIKIRGKVSSLLEVGTGFHPELTGRDNVYLNGAILGMTKADVKKRLDAIVEFAELERFIDTPVKRYSSGMYVRLAFSVAAHLDPDVMIVDEVLAVGDLSFQLKCLGRMDEVSKTGRTILFVSHNMAAISRLCTRAVLLDEGAVRIDGTVHEAVTLYGQDSLHKFSTPGWNELPRGEEYELIEYKVVASDEKPTTSSSLNVNIRIRLLRPVKKLRVGVDVISHNSGMVVFRSYHDDNDGAGVMFKPGVYEFRGIIAGDLLKEGHYRLSLIVGIHAEKWLIKDQVYHDVYLENLNGVNAFYKDDRPGSVSPYIHWSYYATTD